jgi:UTP--glucose-1-phosphate uridylyltransferase
MQLMDVYNTTNASVIAVEAVDWAETDKYGIVGGTRMDDRLLKVDLLVEKPSSHPPSNEAIIGRYILEPDIFRYLEKTPKGAGGEIQLTDALQMFAAHRTLYAYRIEGKLYDVGDKLGFLKATVELGCKDPALKGPFRAFLQQQFGKEGGD